MDMKPEEIESDGVDHAMVVAQEAISAISTGAGILAAIIKDLIPTTFETRTKEFLKQVADELQRLRGGLNEQRVRSESFHITLLKTIRLAIVERHEEKLRAFKDIILNDAISSSENPEIDLFLKITEDLTGNHIRMLKALSDPKEACRRSPQIFTTCRRGQFWWD